MKIIINDKRGEKRLVFSLQNIKIFKSKKGPKLEMRCFNIKEPERTVSLFFDEKDTDIIFNAKTSR